MDRAAVKGACVLVADDEPANVQLLEALLDVSDFTNVVSTTDSSAVVPLCAETNPDLIVLDLYMPHPDGFELMGMLSPWTRASPPLPILVATADVSSETKRRALAAGARDFLTKPYDPSEIVARIENLLEARLLQLDLRRHKAALEGRVREQTLELERAALELLEPLAFAAEYRDEDAREHTLRVGQASGLLARELGLSGDAADVIARAARLHDVGKIGLSDAVLLKPGRYTPEEFELMKSHAVIGAEILGRGESRLLKTAAEIARSHHERWDGSGYPDGLRGEEIPLSGRVVAVADTFDALTHPRLYRDEMPLPEAVGEIRSLGGRHFDPRVVSAFETLDHARLSGSVGDA